MTIYWSPQWSGHSIFHSKQMHFRPRFLTGLIQIKKSKNHITSSSNFTIHKHSHCNKLQLACQPDTDMGRHGEAGRQKRKWNEFELKSSVAAEHLQRQVQPCGGQSADLSPVVSNLHRFLLVANKQQDLRSDFDKEFLLLDIFVTSLDISTLIIA